MIRPEIVKVLEPDQVSKSGKEYDVVELETGEIVRFYKKSGSCVDRETKKIVVPPYNHIKSSEDGRRVVNARWRSHREAAERGLIKAVVAAVKQGKKLDKNTMASHGMTLPEAVELVVQKQTELALDIESGNSSTRAADKVFTWADIFPNDDAPETVHNTQINITSKDALDVIEQLRTKIKEESPG